MIANYHTHNRWCKHGEGEIEDYVEVALSEGFVELAITDHVPHKDNIDASRCQWEEFPAYDAALNKAVETYSDRIRLIKGFECEYYPDVMDEYHWLKDGFGYELMVLGQHWYGKNREYFAFAENKSAYEMEVYADTVCRGLNTGMFHFLAHPDLALEGYAPGWDENAEKVMRQIFSECERLDIPVEINGYEVCAGMAYPNKEAFRLSKDYRLRYLLNMDAHEPDRLSRPYWERAERFAAELGLEVMPTFQF